MDSRLDRCLSSDVAGDQSERYTVRRFQPEDAGGVVACFQETYGNSYPLKDCYDPLSIIEQNSTGKHIAAVAVENITGEVVGHCSLQSRFPWPVAECGQIVVKRGHQGRSLAVRMGQFLEQEAIKVGLVCMVSYAATSHYAAQLITQRAKFTPCGLILGAMPATLEFQNMTGLVAQRESCVIVMKFLVHPKPARISPPEHHRDMISKIYSALGRPVIIQSPPVVTGPGEIVVRESRVWETAEILIRRIGKNTPTEIIEHLHNLLERRIAEVIYLEVPMDQSGVDLVCREAEQAGFFFAGLGPSSTGDGEALILQFLKTQLDLSYPKVVTPLGKMIHAYVRQEHSRVNGLEAKKRG